MLNPELLIRSINKNCKSHFQNSFFNLVLTSSNHNSFSYRSEGTSFAINRHNNNSEQIKVLHWFNNFWLFIEIKFINSNTFVSMSVFQGTEIDEIKHQLFRAEWDDYTNPEEKHPQPHWHITSDYTIEENFKAFSNELDNGTSFSTFTAVKSEIIKIKNLHFAMNGNWQNGGSHIHEIDDIEKVTRWFQGVLFHLRTELEYVAQ
jgi:hypothetical protein